MKTKYYLFGIFLLFISCGHNESERQEIKKETTAHLNVKDTNFEKDTLQTLTENEIGTKALITSSSIFKALSEKTILNKKPLLKTIQTSTPETLKAEPTHFESFVLLRKMLLKTENGTTLTQKELYQTHQIPKDAIKMIKSITKLSENEIAVKWHSNWFIEQISDAKFTDATIKFRFYKNKMYTSGKAIGIKYNKKMYNELVIIGSAAYIPSVKGFHWQIGK